MASLDRLFDNTLKAIEEHHDHLVVKIENYRTEYDYLTFFDREKKIIEQLEALNNAINVSILTARSARGFIN